MQGKSLKEVYLLRLSGHPPNETLLTCVWLLRITPVVWPHRAGNEPGRKTCSNSNIETMYDSGLLVPSRDMNAWTPLSKIKSQL